MPRTRRVCLANEVFHVLNRAVARMTIFERPADYDAFLRVLDETWAEVPLPILAFSAMPNHWHFVVRPTSDGQVSEFFRRLTVTHTMRWHAHDRTGGTGHLYQGRFKSFPVQDDEHLLTVMRYVERNALRANLVERAEDFATGTSTPLSGIPADAQSEAVIALQQLGYKPAEAARMARDATLAGDDTATIIRKALQSALR